MVNSSISRLASQAFMEGTHWVSPNSSTVERVPSNAMDFKLSHFRFAGHAEAGAWKGLDWTEGPDWYDLRVHWRGFMGVGAVVDRRWKTDETHIVTAGGGFKLKATIATWREWEIRELKEHLDEMIKTLELEEARVPVPRAQDVSSLHHLQPNKGGVLKAMAFSRYYYMDLIAFYRWIREVMDEELVYKRWDSVAAPKDLWKSWWSLPMNGYLLDLKEHQKTHNLPLWRERNVPVHYFWTADLANDERFQAWDPWVLQAEDETEGGVPNSQRLLRENEMYGEGWPCDEWTQYRPAYDQAAVVDLPRLREIRSTWRIYVKDFQGWDRRLVTSEEEQDLCERIYFFKDRMQENPPWRTFYRWIEKEVDSALVILRYTSEPHRHTSTFL
ncbi:hypothetical protein HWV62_18068, partial [Athelia sp. TMB]